MSDGKKFKATFESDRYLLNYNMLYQSYDKKLWYKSYNIRRTQNQMVADHEVMI